MWLTVKFEVRWRLALALSEFVDGPRTPLFALCTPRLVHHRAEHWQTALALEPKELRRLTDLITEQHCRCWILIRQVVRRAYVGRSCKGGRSAAVHWRETPEKETVNRGLWRRCVVARLSEIPR